MSKSLGGLHAAPQVLVQSRFTNVAYVDGEYYDARNVIGRRDGLKSQHSQLVRAEARHTVAISAVDGIHSLGEFNCYEDALAAAKEWLGRRFNELVPGWAFVSAYGERVTIRKA